MTSGIVPSAYRHLSSFSSPRHCLRENLRSGHASCTRIQSSFRHLATASNPTPHNRNSVVTIVEVGPRDGLQNEKQKISPSIKAELVNRLARAGLTNIEVGSFVNPKWVPQMAGTPDVLALIEPLPGVRYPVLVPNMRGLDDLFALLASPELAHIPASSLEVALFVAASDAFSRANTNCTVAEALIRAAPVAERAARKGLRVRGYVSVVITCPYSGRIDSKQVRDVARALREIGCENISLGDTNGTGTPRTVLEMLDRVTESVPVEMLAGHFHDTYGSALANIFAALGVGVRTFDSSIGGLGGCPYSPGATGNVATEDVVHALQGSQYVVRGHAYASTESNGHKHERSVDLSELVRIGAWISDLLGRENASRAGRAYIAAERRRISTAAQASESGQ